ncbi:haloacid dehalogenase type II [Actinospica robiniae]|uniref:haloacid dehalogenase type II n=1 Tax=Actinospica robiniae TaxID=304901 RepID=UPI00041047BC|nr:haloacid dehalogenase type II [Actinospica robiniae]
MTLSDSLPEFDAVVFDLVGTLVDEVGTVTGAVHDALADAGIDEVRSTRAAEAWIEAFHAATRRIASGEEEWMPAEQLRRTLLEEVLLAEGIGLTAEAFDALASTGRRLAAWPDAAEQLSELAELTTVSTLTNASTCQVAEISSRHGLRWHATLSAALARTYKPAPAVYALAIEQLDLDPGRTLFVAAHPWDLRGAAASGFHTGYLARPHADAPEDEDEFDVHLNSLNELVEALR